MLELAGSNIDYLPGGTDPHKRQKEKQREEKRVLKAEKKAQRKIDKKDRPNSDGVDPDIAHIVPGPQQETDEDGNEKP